MKHILLLLILFSFFTESVCQCNSVNLFTQQDVDSFIQNYGSCTSADEIYIFGCDSCDVRNVDSLHSIRSVKRLTIASNDIESLRGLINLSKVDHLTFKNSSNLKDPFPTLDSIGQLTHWFNDSIQDLGIYKNVRSITKLHVRRNGYLTGLEQFSVDPSLEIQINENEWNADFSEIIKEYQGSIQSLSLWRSNANLDGLRKISGLRTLGLVACLPMDLGPILDLKISEAINYDERHSLNFESGFSRVDTLLRLYISNTSRLEDIRSIFPNLRAVKHELRISENTSLNTLENFSTFPKIQRGHLAENKRYYLSISHNPKLETCSNPFICQAVRTIPSPDSLAIFNNGIYCTYDSLNVVDCITVSNQDQDGELVTVYPNPTIGPLYLEGIDQGQFVILDLLGRTMVQGEIDGGEIDLGPIGPGAYILKIQGSNQVVKFVKE